MPFISWFCQICKVNKPENDMGGRAFDTYIRDETIETSGGFWFRSIVTCKECSEKLGDAVDYFIGDEKNIQGEKIKYAEEQKIITIEGMGVAGGGKHVSFWEKHNFIQARHEDKEYSIAKARLNIWIFVSAGIIICDSGRIWENSIIPIMLKSKQKQEPPQA